MTAVVLALLLLAIAGAARAGCAWHDVDRQRAADFLRRVRP